LIIGGIVLYGFYLATLDVNDVIGIRQPERISNGVVMADEKVSVVFLVIDVIVADFDLAGLVSVVLGRRRGNILIQESVIFLGQIENFAV